MKKITFALLILIIAACSTAKKDPAKEFKKAENHYQLSLSAFHRGDILSARREINIAIHFAPETAHYLNTLGLILLNDKEYEKAEKSFQKAISLDNLYTDPYNNLGVLYLEKNRVSEAREMFLRVLSDQIYPYPHYALTNLGIISVREGKDQDAERYFSRALRLKPDYCTALKEMGLLSDKRQDRKMALSYYEDAVRYCPDYVEALYLAATRLISEGREEAGKRHLQTCLNIEHLNIHASNIPYIRQCTSLAKSMGLKLKVEKSKGRKELGGE